MTVNESPQQKLPQTPQQQAPQQRTRGRITTDGQTSRRPRPVAGQRAAAKRAAQPTVDTASTDAASIHTAPTADPTLPEPRELVETVESAVVEPEVVEEVDRASTSKPRLKPDRKRPPRPRTSTTTTSTRNRRAIVTAILAVALIAAVAIGAILAVQYRNVIRTDHARTAAMAAAERAAPVIFSYDYRHLDQDFSKAEAYLTGGFRDQYAKTTVTVVKPTALQYHGVVQAVVAKPADGSAPAVSVVSASPDQVVVLAFIDQSTTSTRVNGTQVDQNRVLLTLTHTSQGWLVSAVSAL